MTREPILTTRGLVKRYGRVTALDHADFDLYPGEILAVIGDNGAGKSSLIKAICARAVRLHVGINGLHNSQLVARDRPIDVGVVTIVVCDVAEGIGNSPQLPAATPGGASVVFQGGDVRDISAWTIDAGHLPRGIVPKVDRAYD